MPHLGKMVLVSVEILLRRMCLVYVKNNMAWRGMAIARELLGIGEIIVCRIILHHKEQLVACDLSLIHIYWRFWMAEKSSPRIESGCSASSVPLFSIDVYKRQVYALRPEYP